MLINMWQQSWWNGDEEVSTKGKINKPWYNKYDTQEDMNVSIIFKPFYS